ncbi:tetratricopeptide repeat protein [Haloarchaeobius sp. HRN-SO-5]|uniref:tetratricopeptide repeat protein n=1 Tax=Haloarchaeobius sp. HRN-SO-5 TaxID=3446118 RepID=UPI003EBAA060
MCPDATETTVDVLDRRRDVLTRLGTSPVQVRDLCASLEVSRSTVNRALRELEDVGWARRTGNGYVRTTSGALALEQYQDQISALGAVQEHAEALDPLPEDTPLDPALLPDAHVESIGDWESFELAASVRESIEGATSLRGVWPTIGDDRTVETVATLASEGGPVALAVTGDVADTLQSVDACTFGCDGPETCRVDQYDSVPTRLGVFDLGTPDGRTILAVVYGDHGTVHAVVRLRGTDAVQWAESVFADVGMPELASDAPADGTDTADHRTEDWSPDARETLRSAGFVPVSDATLARETPQSVGTMLRTGPTLAAVDEGLSLCREHSVDGARREFAVDLVDALSAGTDVAVVGPPGSGKSTTCKAVACRWRDRGLGPVCYRESGARAVLDDPGSLVPVLDATDGHVLVVVEDAVRPTASAVFEVLEEVGADADVSFLFDARLSEWSDPPAPLDARRESLRREAVETVPVPRLDDRERDRLHAHVDGLVAEPLPPRSEFDVSTEGAELTDSATLDDGTTDDGAGELLSLTHRYGLFADSSDGDGGHGVSSLQQDVHEVYDSVSADGDALAVATLVNVLNATGLPVERDLVDAIAVDPDGPDPAAVESTLRSLRGRVIFDTGAGDSVHGSWSHAFLRRLVADRDDASAHRTFARAVGSLFTLLESADRRQAVVAHRQGDAPTVSAIDDRPDHWADVVVDRVFELGRNAPGLAPLYGRGEHSQLRLPESVSTTTRQLALVARARMYADAGEYDDALEECEHIDGVAASLDDEREATVLEARNLRVQSFVFHRRGDFDRAWRLVLESLERIREAGHPHVEARTLNGAGVVAWLRGDVEEAERLLTEGLSMHRDGLDYPKGEADLLNNLGIQLRERGELAAAADRFRECHERRREVGARMMAIDSANNLAVVARDRGELDNAVGWLHVAIEESKLLGTREREAHTSRALGNVLRRKGDLDESATRLERALELARADERRHGQFLCLRGLAATRREQGRLDEAATHLDACEALADDVGDERDSALVRAERGQLQHARGAMDDAVESLEAAVESLESVDRTPGLARVRRALARALDDRGDHSEACDQYEAACDQYEALGATRYLRETLDELSAACERAGAAESAATYRDRRDALGASN